MEKNTLGIVIMSRKSEKQTAHAAGAALQLCECTALEAVWLGRGA